MTSVIGRVLRWLGYSIAGVIILAATAVSIARLSMPLLNSHRADFEKWASDLLQTPVTMTQVHISWYHFEPILVFQKIAIIDKKTSKPAFEIHKLKINMSLIESLVQRKFLLENIILDGVSLTVYQKKSGQLHVKGLSHFSVQDNLTGTDVGANTVTTWILARPYLQLRNIAIQFVSDKQQKRFFTLTKLALKNTKTTHELNGQVILNQKTPTKATIQLLWAGDTLDILNNISRVQLYLYLESVSVRQWLDQNQNNPYTWRDLQIQQGLGSGKIWATWDHGQLQKIQTQFQCYEIQLKSVVTQKTVVISHASGNVNWQRDGDRQLVSGENISLDFPHHPWPMTHFSLTLLPKASGYYLQAGYLDLADSSALALASGLLTEPMKKQLLQLNPKGEIRVLSIESADITQPEHNVYSAEFSGLSMNAWQRLPSINHMTGIISLDEHQGNVRLNSHQAIVDFNSIFPKPLFLDDLSGNFRWEKTTKDTWRIAVEKLQIKNADIDLSADMTMMLPKDTSPLLNLTGHFSFANVEKIENYLPMKLFEPPLVKWLPHRFQSGKIASSKVIVQGKLSDFPFEKGEGKFLVDAAVENLEFEYAPEWPALHHLYGKLVFSGASMTVDTLSAQLFDIPLTQVHATIPYIGSAHPQILHLQTLINTDISSGLRFIRTSPLQKTIGKNLEGMQLTGPMKLKLACIIPVRTPEQSQVIGDLQVSSAKLQLPDWNIELDHLAGALKFTEASIQTTKMQGYLFNKPITLGINTEHKPNTPPVVNVMLEGKIALPTFETWLRMPLAPYLTGEAIYTAELRIISPQYAQPTQLLIRSSLVGVAVNVPMAYASYAKKENERRDFELKANLKTDQPLLANMTYGKLATAALTYQKLMQGWQFKTLDIQAKQVPLLGQTLASASVQVSPVDNTWKIGITSATIIGQLWVPKEIVTSQSNQANQANQAIRAEFKRLYLTPAGNQQSFDIKTIPAFSFIGEDVRYGGKSLGRVELTVMPDSSGIKIKKLSIHSSFFNLKAKGSWLSLNSNNYQTNFQGTFKTHNVSQLLEIWGLGLSNLIAETGRAEFNLSWQNAPYNPTLASLSGNILLTIGKGRVINLGNSTNAKIGFGRMLNILNLQTLPRRLSLDFTDLFEKGYVFDSMKGEFSLKQGNAVTQDTYFDGSIARIEIKGRVGLATKDYGLTLSVTPYVTGSIPIVATLAGGPIVGAVTWLVEKIASSAVSSVVTYHYSVTGPWENPKWEQVTAKKK